MSLIERLIASLDDPADGLEPLRGDYAELVPMELTPAAVLIPIVAHPEPTVLLTRRTDTLRKHAGQVAFPGGRIDPEDDGPIAAALREAQEEVALPPHLVEVIGTADPYETGTGYRITPVVGIVPPDVKLVPAEAEVAALFEVPLAHLMDPANHEIREAEFGGRMRRYYVIEWKQHHIWGATAAIIVNLAKRLAMMKETRA